MSLSRKVGPSLEAAEVKADPEFTKARFKFFSLRSLAFLLIYNGVFIGYICTLMLQQNFFRDLINAVAEVFNPFDSATEFIFRTWYYLVAPTPLLFVAHAFPKLGQIAMVKNLKWPKYFQTNMLSLCFFLCGCILICLGNFLEFSPKLFTYSLLMRITILFVAPSLCYIFSGV